METQPPETILEGLQIVLELQKSNRQYQQPTLELHTYNKKIIRCALNVWWSSLNLVIALLRKSKE